MPSKSFDCGWEADGKVGLNVEYFEYFAQEFAACKSLGAFFVPDHYNASHLCIFFLSIYSFITSFLLL